MSESEYRSGPVMTASRSPRGPNQPPAPPSAWNWMFGRGRPGSGFRKLLAVLLVFVLGSGLSFWEIRGFVVPQNHVLVLMKKNGSRSLTGDQVIIPRPPAEGT